MKNIKLLGVLTIIVYLISSCCKDKPDNNNFIVTDFPYDTIIGKNDTMLIDINQDGKYDFKIYQHKYSSGENPIFESIDSSCMLSLGVQDGLNIIKWIFKGDTINYSLTWGNNIPWTIDELDTLNARVYLGIRLKDAKNSYYYGWLLPKVKDNGYHAYLVYIEKYVYCKEASYQITSG
jgi:hypothetical protein